MTPAEAIRVPSKVNEFAGLLPEPPDPFRYDHPGSDPQDPHSLLANWVPKGARVLDIGAGTGTLAVKLRDERDATVVCVEPDVDRAVLARERGLIVHTTDLDTFAESRPESFDVAILADVIEHLSYPATVLSTAHRLLKPSGHLLVSVPNAAHWTIRWSLLRGRFDYETTGLMDATHLRWFTLASLRRLLEGCGFAVESSVGTLGDWHSAYTKFPWRVLPRRYRTSVLRRLVRRLPTVFGIQHILRARAVEI
jgi:methionine biosynthesis protein MetW